MVKLVNLEYKAELTIFRTKKWENLSFLKLWIICCYVSNKPRKSIGSVQEKVRERVREDKEAENDKTKKEGSDSDSDLDSDEESIGISDVN